MNSRWKLNLPLIAIVSSFNRIERYSEGECSQLVTNKPENSTLSLALSNYAGNVVGPFYSSVSEI